MKVCFRKYMQLEACLKLALRGNKMVHSKPVSFTNHLVLGLSINQEQPRALTRFAMVSNFCHLEKNPTCHMGSNFLIWHALACKLTFKHTIVPYAMCLGTIGIRLKWFEDLMNAFEKSNWRGLLRVRR